MTRFRGARLSSRGDGTQLLQHKALRPVSGYFTRFPCSAEQVCVILQAPAPAGSLGFAQHATKAKVH